MKQIIYIIIVNILLCNYICSMTSSEQLRRDFGNNPNPDQQMFIRRAEVTEKLNLEKKALEDYLFPKQVAQVIDQAVKDGTVTVEGIKNRLTQVNDVLSYINDVSLAPTTVMQRIDEVNKDGRTKPLIALPGL